MSDEPTRRGRPSLPDGEAKDQVTSLRIRPSLYADLQAIAEANGTTISALLNSCAEDLVAMPPEGLKAWLACPRCKGSGQRHG